jgi:hypothetical protein
MSLSILSLSVCLYLYYLYLYVFIYTIYLSISLKFALVRSLGHRRPVQACVTVYQQRQGSRGGARTARTSAWPPNHCRSRPAHTHTHALIREHINKTKNKHKIKQRMHVTKTYSLAPPPLSLPLSPPLSLGLNCVAAILANSLRSACMLMLLPSRPSELVPAC